LQNIARNSGLIDGDYELLNRAAEEAIGIPAWFITTTMEATKTIERFQKLKKKESMS